jgi:hypothetical protein
MPYDEAKVDEAVLAVLYLTAWQDRGVTFAWKAVDWEVTARLFGRGLIDDPRSKSRSLVFTDEGAALARVAAQKLFAIRSAP